MSTSINYNKSKLDAFINAYNEMQNELVSFNDTVTSFSDIVNTFNYSDNIGGDDNQRYAKFHFFESPPGATTSQQYLMTSQNIIMKVNGTFNQSSTIAKIPIITLTSDSSDLLNNNEYNKIITIEGTINDIRDGPNINQTIQDYITENGDSQKSYTGLYISDQIEPISNNYNNVITQLLRLNNNVQTSYDMKELMSKTLVDNDKDVKSLKDGTKQNIYESTGNLLEQSCGSKMYQKCLMETVVKNDGVSDIMFALHQNSPQGFCECHDLTGTGVENEPTISFYEKKDSKLIYDHTGTAGSMNFFGVFMNGYVGGLKESIYKDNFIDFFKVNDINNKFIDIDITNNLNGNNSSHIKSKIWNNLNPFVGHGMYDFNIQESNG